MKGDAGLGWTLVLVAGVWPCAWAATCILCRWAPCPSWTSGGYCPGPWGSRGLSLSREGEGNSLGSSHSPTLWLPVKLLSGHFSESLVSVDNWGCAGVCDWRVVCL